MKRIASLIATLGLLVSAPYASAQKAETLSPYAIEDCKVGCYLVKSSSTSGSPVYVGATPRTFRICSSDAHGGAIKVDGKNVDVDGTTLGVHSCRDVNGLNIVVVKGIVAVGAVP